MTSFLQTTEWLEFQKKAGHKVWRYSNKKITANIIKYNLPLRKSYLYIPHGPEIDFKYIGGGFKNELTNFITYLKDLAKNENAIFVKMEPLANVVIELLYRRGFRRSTKQIQPYKTVVLNLNLSEEHLLGKMHTKTRYNIKVAEKHGVVIKQSHDIDMFWKLLKKTSKRDQFASHVKDYYKNLLEHFRSKENIKTDLFLAYQNNKPVAGAIVLQYGLAGYYLHGASDYDARAMMAPYALHWEIIKYLKSSGIEYYDFWGIDAKKWPGVTRFKLGWGGDIIEHPGSFDFIISRTWYLAYTLARKLF